jgi:Domain of unknown function (DUF6468)
MSGLGTIIDCVVAILLVLTIGYCMMLNRRLKLLKADEQSLRATISELVTATEIAERAIGGLKITVHECDMGLGERLRKAERVVIEIDRAVVSGKDLVSRLSQIVGAGRRTDDSAAAIAEARRGDAKTTAQSDAKPEIETDSKPEGKAERTVPAKTARAVAAAAEAFAERLRTKVHGLAA